MHSENVQVLRPGNLRRVGSYLGLAAALLLAGSTAAHAISGEVASDADVAADAANGSTKVDTSSLETAAPPTKSSTASAPAGPLWRDGNNTPVVARQPYDPARSLAPMIEAVKPGVVRIETQGEARALQEPDFFPFMPPQGRRPRAMGMGSGFVLRSDGWVVTNNHVVEEQKKVKVVLADGRSFEAKVVGSDPQTDVALLKIDGAKNLPTVVLGSSKSLAVGDWVVAIGAPLGLEQTVTRGILSAKGRGDLGLYENGYVDFLQTDAAISPGNSGGPLFNLNGEVIGINSAIAARGNDLGFAVPIDQAKHILAKLHQHGKVERGWLGIVGRMIQTVGDGVPPKGALIEDVQSGGPGQKAGLQAKDRVVAIDGQPIENFAELRQHVAQLEPGRKVTLDVIRNGQPKQLIAQLTKQPSAEELAANDGNLKRRGTSLYGEGPARLGVQAEVKGQQVLVREIVDPEGVGAALGLQPGDEILSINGQLVDSLADLKSSLEKDRKRAMVKVRRRHETLHLSVVAR